MLGRHLLVVLLCCWAHKPVDVICKDDVWSQADGAAVRVLNLGAAAAQQRAAGTQNGLCLKAQGKAGAHTEYRAVCGHGRHLGSAVLLSTKMSPV